MPRLDCPALSSGAGSSGWQNLAGRNISPGGKKSTADGRMQARRMPAKQGAAARGAAISLGECCARPVPSKGAAVRQFVDPPFHRPASLSPHPRMPTTRGRRTTPTPRYAACRKNGHLYFKLQSLFSRTMATENVGASQEGGSATVPCSSRQLWGWGPGGVRGAGWQQRGLTGRKLLPRLPAPACRRMTTGRGSR